MDFFIGIELTRHCNLRCEHCFRADLDKFSEIPFETVESILDQAQSYHRPHIALTGGETTLHTRFVEILELILNKGFSFHFVTNGFNYKTLYKKLYHLFPNPKWTGISVSLDGSTAEVHDKIRGKDSFERALAAIAIAKTFNKEVVTQMIVHRGNRHDVENMAILCSKMGVDRLHLAHMQPTPHAVEAGLLHSPQEYRQVEREIRDLQSQFRMPIVLSAGFYDQTPVAHCRFLKLSALNIDHEGRLTTCCQLSNLDGSEGLKDVVADLKKVPLAIAHTSLLGKYNELFSERLKKLVDGKLNDIDNFHCWSCMKHFKKVEWMKNFPQNEWTQQDPYFQFHGIETKQTNEHLPVVQGQPIRTVSL